jgi:glycosidase
VLDGWFSDDLPDLNQEEPEVARYEIQNALWWVGMTGIDGIRQDTIQYMPRFFIRDLSNALHREYPKLWMVGEVFEREAPHTAVTRVGTVSTQSSILFSILLCGMRRCLCSPTRRPCVRCAIS